VERRPNLRATPQWTAVPEPEEAKVAVNIVASAPAPSPAASSRLGMSDKEARSDLNSYFSTLAAQAKSQEKKHAEQVLGLSQGDDSSSDDSSRTAKKVSTRQSLGASTHGEKVADKKVEALMKLVEKAAASKRFQEALVDASRDTFRGSIPGNFE